MQPRVAPVYLSSHRQPDASGYSFDLANIDQQQTKHEDSSQTRYPYISDHNDGRSLLESLDGNHATPDLPAVLPASGFPALTYQQPHVVRQPAQSSHPSSLAQPGSTNQKSLPVTEPIGPSNVSQQFEPDLTSPQFLSPQAISNYKRLKEELGGQWPMELKFDVVKRIKEVNHKSRGLNDMANYLRRCLGVSRQTTTDWWSKRQEILLHEQEVNVIRYIRDRGTGQENKEATYAAAARQFNTSIHTVRAWWEEREELGLRDKVLRYINENRPGGVRHQVVRDAASIFEVSMTRVSRWLAWVSCNKSRRRRKGLLQWEVAVNSRSGGDNEDVGEDGVMEDVEANMS